MTRLGPTIVLLALSALAACGGEAPAPGAQTAVGAAAAPAPDAPAETARHNWRSNPAAGVTLTVNASDTLLAHTGPHAVLWDEAGAELAPPYTVRATLAKTSGRIHEGVGLVFGGSGLDGAEGGQVYSYFLVRGDGSYLVKRRQGPETPVVRDWTAHPAIRRDRPQEAPRANELEVRVGEAEVAFLVNGAEVARVPAAELSVRGRAGVRASHDVELRVSGFGAAPGADAAPAGAPR
jgi:hypothetical protein